MLHFTISRKVNYDARDLIEKNRDMIPSEMLETLRSSNEHIVKLCFTNPLSKTGNLTMAMDSHQPQPNPNGRNGSKWGKALITETTKCRVRLCNMRLWISYIQMLLENEHIVSRALFSDPQNANTRHNLSWNFIRNFKKSLDCL